MRRKPHRQHYNDLNRLSSIDLMKFTFLLLTALTVNLSLAPAGVTPLPDKVAAVVPDKQASQIPDAEKLTGMLGERVQNSAINRLLQTVDPDRLLEGYRKRPGRQEWDGEHIGKWIHAATLAWVYTGNAELRAKLDKTVTELIKCQLEDGYLGTYEPEKRWTSWDVWSHKYNLIGLLTYIRYTGNLEALPACQKMGDLLCKTFGEGPGQKRVIQVGGHAGMASSSVLEPMVWLYRLTGEPRYRTFCEQILSSWERPEGPHIVSRLVEGQGVHKVGNGKAYEMLSCLNGMLEWYRVTGDDQLLQAALNAWKDIVAKRLYITGTCSSHEHFQGDYDLINYGNVGETCVTVTWLQFNAHLLRLTGEARFADQLERIAYNQLPGAQRPNGKGWGYYVQMKGLKPYNENLTGSCCLSSGPRGMALLPTFALTTDADGVVINFYDPATATLTLADRSVVALDVQSQYPAAESITITVKPAKPQTFALKLRIPSWCDNASLQVSGQSAPLTPGKDGYVAINRLWQPGDKVTLTLPLKARLIAGDHTNEGKAALAYGPLILAVDAALSDGQNNPALPGLDLAALKFTVEPAKETYLAWPEAQVFRITVDGKNYGLAPFATAGCTGSRFRVWMRLAGAIANDNLLENGIESRSRQGNLEGSILDDLPVVTFDGKMATEDWYAVTLDKPITIGKLVFSQGKLFHNGGWFDASAGKPQVQIQETKNSEWKTVGELAKYPSTTATDNAKIRAGQDFIVTFSPPLTATAVRVLGKPASGDAPHQAFSSCAGLRATAP